MARRYLIGIDLGTTSAKCVIYDDEGNVAAEASRDMVITYPSSGEAEQNAEDFYTVTCGLIKKCLAESNINGNDIAAVGIDSQMGGILAIDKNYNPATRYDTPLDSRSGGENTWMHERFGDLIIEKNGSISTFGNKILYWKKRDEWKNIHKFIQPSAFVAGRFAGLSADEAYMDETFICFSGFADLKNSCWNSELCEAMDVDRSKLPRIVKSTDIIGEVCRKASADSGLPLGLPIAAGCGDQIAGFTGAGILEPGRMIDVSGTACILGLSTDNYTYDLQNRTLACMKSAIGNTFYLISVVLGGRTHNWFIDQFCAEDTAAAAASNQSVYQYLDAKAAAIPAGSEGLVSINYLQGRFFPPEPSVRGLLIGHTWGHTRHHFYRAILESIAYDHYLTKEIMKSLVPDSDFTTVTAIGSGANSELWMRIKADVLGQTYMSLSRSDLSTLGAAIVAGYGAGVFTDIESITRRFGKSGKLIRPRRGEFEKYAPLIEVYKNLFPCVKDSYQKISERNG